MLPLQGARILFLVGELRSCKPRSMAEKKKKETFGHRDRRTGRMPCEDESRDEREASTS